MTSFKVDNEIFHFSLTSFEGLVSMTCFYELKLNENEFALYAVSLEESELEKSDKLIEADNLLRLYKTEGNFYKISLKGYGTIARLIKIDLFPIRTGPKASIEEILRGK